LKGFILTNETLKQLKNRKGILKFNTTNLALQLWPDKNTDYTAARLDKRARGFSEEELVVIHKLLREELKEISALIKQ
jgi:hypothetical protein